MDEWSSVARYRRHPRDHGTWARTGGSHRRGRETIAILAATLTVGTLAGITALRGTGRSSHHDAASTTSVSVLGEELTKPSTPTADAPGDTPVPVPQPLAAAPSEPPLQVAVATAGTTVPAVSTAAPATHAPAPAVAPVAASPLPAQPVVIHAFNGATFSFSPDPRQDTAASSATSDRNAANPVLLEVDGQADNTTAAVSVKVTNDSGRAIAFPGGLSVVVTLARDGSVVASTTASDPGVVTLAPSGTAVLGARVPLSSYGSYSVDGTLSYRSA